MATNVLSWTAFIINAISFRCSVKATDAATHLLKVDLNFRIGKVSGLCTKRACRMKHHASFDFSDKPRFVSRLKAAFGLEASEERS